jgi:3-hydroxybutyrate dehydrogenase
VSVDKLVSEFRSRYDVKAAYNGADMSAPAEARMKLLGEKQSSLEFATPEEIGAAALFLCSQAAAQIRGIALPVDGGLTAQ